MRPHRHARRRAPAAAALVVTLALGGCAAGRGSGPALPPAPELDAASIAADVAWLADDARDGRGAGTRGLDDAAAWLARAFAGAGLAPGGADGGFLQRFEMPVSIRVARERLRAGALAFEAQRDFAALLSSGDGAVSGPLVFAGYGLSVPEREFDEWSGLDARGAVVLVIEDRPAGDRGPFAGVHANAFLSRAHKIANAREHGAAAVLLAPSAADGDDAALLEAGHPSANPSQQSSGIPVLALSRAAAERLVAREAGASLAALQAGIDAHLRPASRALAGGPVAVDVAIERRSGSAANVIGILEGADPALRREAVVIGAHYDHLGRGEFGTLAPDRRGEVHNGADDNASGSAGVLALARAFAAGPRPRRSLVFALFAGEESGLFGSRAYVESPPVPLAETVAMLNLDMVGRLRDRRLTVFGTGSSPAFPALAQRALAGLPLEGSFSEDGFAPSDQTSFYARGVPVLMFFTGVHPEYHTPDDDAPLVDAHGEALVLRAVYRSARALADDDARPAVVAATAPAPATGGEGGGYGPYLGTIPAFGGPDGPGVLLQGVARGSPAERAGIRGGDRVVGWNGARVANLEEYAALLFGAREGDLVRIALLRGSERVEVVAKLGRRR